MVKKRSGAPAAKPAALRHVLVVGGTTREWDELGRELWTARRNELAKVVSHAGATWLTLRPFGPDPAVAADHLQPIVDVREGCTLIVDPAADGRQRPLDAIDEAAIAAVLVAPAPVEPDLTIVLGPREHLPPSLVWELAYSEIVSI